MDAKPVLEACISTVSEAIYATKNGAHQLEVCSHLELDGLTPDEETLNSILNSTHLPCKVMIRSRAGDFFYTGEEIKIMVNSVSQFKAKRIQGFVFGALFTESNGKITLDYSALYQFCKAAYPFPVTIHKAIDQCDEILNEIDKLKNIANVHFILSSGGAPDAISGAGMLFKMKKASGNKIEIIAAGKITQANYKEVLEKTGVHYLHGKKIV